MTPRKTVERRRASTPVPRASTPLPRSARASTPQPRGVQFRRETSIASVHYIDPLAPPERHLSDEPGMQCMEANVKERKVKSLQQKRADNGAASSMRLGMIPTPTR